LGTILYKTAENNKHNIIPIKNPVNIPKLNIMPFLKPTFLALFIAIILAVAGIYDTIIIYDKNEIHGNIGTPYFH
jgi:hypothetical protein